MWWVPLVAAGIAAAGQVGSSLISANQNQGYAAPSQRNVGSQKFEIPDIFSGNGGGYSLLGNSPRLSQALVGGATAAPKYGPQASLYEQNQLGQEISSLTRGK